MQELLSIMTELPLFSALSLEQCAHFAPLCRLRDMAKGTAIFHENELAQGLFVVVEGMAKVTRCTPEGREVVLFLVRRGQCLGESGVFPRGTHPTDAHAVTTLKLLFIPADLMENIIRASPATALDLLAALSQRLRMFSHKIKTERQGNATRRLATYLLHRSQLHGGSERVRLEVSREVLANLLGLARETLSRQLTLLATAGIIELQGKTVVLLHRDELVRIAAKA